jgi:heme-degrading monooxygenase HmoA
MYLVREVFHTKPGKAKELVKKFKQSAPYFEKQGMKGFRVMTDIATTYWTVVLESEVENLQDFAKETRSATSQPEVEKIMQGYLDLVLDGYREIFLIE